MEKHKQTKQNIYKTQSYFFYLYLNFINIIDYYKKNIFINFVKLNK